MRSLTSKLLMHAVMLCLVALLSEGCDEDKKTCYFYPVADQFDLPFGADTLNVLLVGNSFTHNLCVDLPGIVNRNYSDVHCNIGVVAKGGSTISNIHSWHYENRLVTYAEMTRKGWTPYDTINVSEVYKRHDWNVVVVQLRAYESGNYYRCQPYLNRTVDIINALAPGACVVLYSPWAVGSNHENVELQHYGNSPEVMYDSIVSLRQELLRESHIKVVLDATNAMNELRHTSLNNPPLDLTSDGLHADEGVGYYLLGCLFCETILEPITGRCVIGDQFVSNRGNVHVDKVSAELCQKIAHQVEAVSRANKEL